jgi:ligand-binding SRPBCC domain-containing protein
MPVDFYGLLAVSSRQHRLRPEATRELKGKGTMATTPVRFPTLRREQWLPRPVEDVFAFFSEAANLGVITPPWLAFQILTPPARISEGVKIRYRIGWRGVPMTWTTVIRRWDPPHGFVDVQLQGPYQLWHHTHRFEPHNGGTRMRDIVRYRLPLGIIGRAAHFLRVRQDIEKIFDYRFQRIAELFGGNAPLERG